MAARSGTSTKAAVVATVAFAVALMAGCGPSGSPTPSSPKATDGPAAAAATSSTAPVVPAKVALPTNGQCVLITMEQATSLLGSTPKKSASTGAGTEIKRIDGCTYTGATSNLGYDVNDLSGAGMDPKLIVQQGLAGAAQAPGATKFDVPGGDAAVGFTMAVGAKTMARIEIAKGSYTVAVNAVSPDPAKAKQIGLAAAATLVAAIS